ncbi:DUF6716 putative glycosyltransferase [Campylobacter sp. W0066.1]|uniref:DUF6716 putative glycosyltransferase n=1 Tax=Campylobacter sp. W0066.1 TaxID=2735751 RepID=UPI002985840C|nr:hypothetical protein [Campylobacter sp. W0066.1]HEG2606836.1 hypothetical protein [Campylobacter lari]
MKVLILSDFDSRLKWGLSFAFFLKKYYKITIYCKEKNLSQFQSYCLDEYNILKYDNLIYLLQQNNIFLDYDLIFLSLGGGENIKFFYYLNQFYDKYQIRPLVVTGMNGLTDSNDTHALLCRIGADLICVNSLENLKNFKKKMSLLGLSSNNLFYSGYGRLYNQNKIPYNNEIKTILFVEQPSIPKHIKQKKYLVEKIIEYANRYPLRRIIIKKRAILHKQHMNAHLKDDTIFDFFMKNNIKIPNNLIFNDSSVEELMYQVDLCVSFYSTVIIEAIALGVRSIIIKDFGIGRSNENHHFIGSGLLISLNEWIEDKIPNVNQEWKKNNCELIDENVVLSLINLIDKLKFSKIGKANVFYNKKDFPYFYNFLYRKNKVQSFIGKYISFLKSKIT